MAKNVITTEKFAITFRYDFYSVSKKFTEDVTAYMNNVIFVADIKSKYAFKIHQMNEMYKRMAFTEEFPTFEAIDNEIERLKKERDNVLLKNDYHLPYELTYMKECIKEDLKESNATPEDVIESNIRIFLANYGFDVYGKCKDKTEAQLNIDRTENYIHEIMKRCFNKVTAGAMATTGGQRGLTFDMKALEPLLMCTLFENACENGVVKPCNIPSWLHTKYFPVKRAKKGGRRK